MTSPLDNLLKSGYYDHVIGELRACWSQTLNKDKTIIIFRDFTYRELLESSCFDHTVSNQNSVSKKILISTVIKAILLGLPEADDLYLHDYFNMSYDKRHITNKNQ